MTTPDTSTEAVARLCERAEADINDPFLPMEVDDQRKLVALARALAAERDALKRQCEDWAATVSRMQEKHDDERDRLERERDEAADVYTQVQMEFSEKLDAALARVEALEEALEWYADQFCEFSKYHEGCGKHDDDTCAGCKARAALAGEKTDD
jgi:molecular chaperone GrpE (heat shock protein)